MSFCLYIYQFIWWVVLLTFWLWWLCFFLHLLVLMYWCYLQVFGAWDVRTTHRTLVEPFSILSGSHYWWRGAAQWPCICYEWSSEIPWNSAFLQLYWTSQVYFANFCILVFCYSVGWCHLSEFSSESHSSRYIVPLSNKIFPSLAWFASQVWQEKRFLLSSDWRRPHQVSRSWKGSHLSSHEWVRCQVPQGKYLCKWF